MHDMRLSRAQEGVADSRHQHLLCAPPLAVQDRSSDRLRQANKRSSIILITYHINISIP
jgi:hypothetical protein